MHSDLVITAVPEAEAIASPESSRLARIRRFCAISYFAGIVIGFAWLGVPTSRGVVSSLVLLGLLIACIGRGRRQRRQMVVDWVPFTAALVAYDQTRGLANKIGIPLHETDILRAERWLFGGTEPTVWLQQHLYNPSHVYWYDAVLTLIYTSHFLATPILAAVLWLRDRAWWMRFVSRVVLLSIAGVITYVLFPEAPPWMAARDGFSAPVERLSARGWIWLHAGNIKQLLERAQDGGSNPVAAMPSLHFAFSVLVALFIGYRIRSRLRYLLVLYPLAMGFALVYLGEHYVLDIVVGLVYAIGAHLAMIRIEAWWLVRRASAARGNEALDRA